MNAEYDKLRARYERDMAAMADKIERLRNLAADLMDLVNEMPVKHPQQDTRRKILLGQCKQFGVYQQKAEEHKNPPPSSINMWDK